MRLVVILGAVGLFGTAFAASSKPELRTFQTADGTMLAADIYKPDNKQKSTVLMLHMLQKDRSAFGPLLQSLTKQGYGIINADLRGHGQSVTTIRKQRLDYRSFSAADWLKLPSDAKCLVDYAARDHDLSQNNFVLVGSSIGANTVAMLLADPRVKGAVLLSPGDEYHGLRPMAYLNATHKPVLAIAGRADDYSARCVASLKQSNAAAEVDILNTSAHGNDLLSSPAVVQRIDAFIAKIAR